MREILFRGKRKDNREWADGDLMTKYIHHEGHLTIVQGGCVYYQVIPESVGQLTGLKDKNGNKIFEGDICRHTECDLVCVVEWSESGKWVVNYVFSKRCVILSDRNEYIEVIGNVYDNLELIKI